MMNKRGDEKVIWTMITLVLAAVFAVVFLLFVYPKIIDALKGSAEMASCEVGAFKGNCSDSNKDEESLICLPSSSCPHEKDKPVYCCYGKPL